MPCPPPGDLPDPGIEWASLMSPAPAGGFFTASTTWEAHNVNRPLPLLPHHLRLPPLQIMVLQFGRVPKTFNHGVLKAHGPSAWGHLNWGCLSPWGGICLSTVAILPLGGELASPPHRGPCKVSSSLVSVSSTAVFLFILLMLFSALWSFRMVCLLPMAGYCLAFGSWFSNGFRAMEWEIPDEMLQSLMSCQKHFSWDLRSPWCTGGSSHCSHSSALFSSKLTASRSWSFESKYISHRIRTIQGEANPSLTVGRGFGTLKTCLMLSSTPRLAYRDIWRHCY